MSRMRLVTHQRSACKLQPLSAQRENESCCRLERDVGLRLAMESSTRKWFPYSNSSREVC